LNKPIIIVDADPAVYSAGFAAQKSTYEYVVELPDGSMQHEFFASGDAGRAWLKLLPEGTQVLSKDKHIEAETEDHARQCCATMFKHMIMVICKEWGVDRSDINLEFYLSGPDNFRYDIATIAPYKAGRADPPVHYNTVRNYIVERYAATVVHGQEADDAVSIRCRQLAADGVRYVLATIDKDLDQVPGPHYDYRQHVFYDVSPSDAQRFFWRQVLSGDATDNIPGLYKIGEGRAEKLIDKWLTEKRPRKAADLDRMMWPLVVAAYAENMERYPDKFPAGMTPEAAALETARLVKMREYEGQIWTPT
jgi:hypothetical protein